MTDNTGGVDLEKRTDLDTPRASDLEGVRRDDGGTSARSVVIAIALLAIVAVGAFLLFGLNHGAKDPASVPTVTKTEPAEASLPVEMNDKQVETATTETSDPVDYRERARVKICRALAREFLNAQSPTREQQQRTLIVYKINDCSNGFIADAYAEKVDLTAEETKALQVATDFGALRVEDE